MCNFINCIEHHIHILVQNYLFLEEQMKVLLFNLMYKFTLGCEIYREQ